MENGGGFFGFMNKLGDMFFLNLVFILTCIPVVTIGPALTALYTVTLKMAKGQEGYVVKSYFKAFKDNLKQGLPVGIVLEIALFVLIYDAKVLLYSEAVYGAPGFFITIAAVVLIVMMVHYLFPLMARYENKLSTTILNSIILAVSKLPTTILLVALTAVPVVLVWTWPYMGIYVICIGVVLSAYFQSKLLNKLLDKLENK